MSIVRAALHQSDDEPSAEGQATYIAFTKVWNQNKEAFDVCSSKYIWVPIEMARDQEFDLVRFITWKAADRLSRAIRGEEIWNMDVQAAEKLFHLSTVTRSHFHDGAFIGDDKATGVLYKLGLSYTNLSTLCKYPADVVGGVLRDETIVNLRGEPFIHPTGSSSRARVSDIVEFFNY